MNANNSRRPTGGRAKKGRLRRGVAIVELAIVLPVLLMAIIGMIEFSWLFLTKHTMVHAAREGARALAVQDATVAQAEARARLVLQQLGFNPADFTVQGQLTGTEARMSVSVPASSISVVGNAYGWITGKVMSAHASMMEEQKS